MPIDACHALDAELNPEQRAVVMAPPGSMLVIAGAGTGKTRVLTSRVAWLLAGGADPDRLLLCTFTDRAAREMLRRVEALTGVATGGLHAGTFHHVARKLAREHRAPLGLPEGFGILDRDEAHELLGECLAAEGGAAGREGRLPPAGLLQSLLSRAINTGAGLAEATRHEAPRYEAVCDAITRVVGRFAARKAALGMLDFDDLLLLWKGLLVDPPAGAGALRDRFEHVLCDEYQDTSRLQGELVELSARGACDLTVVGDDAQAIYSFRGADHRNMLEFPARHPEARVCRLETSYRSSPEILRLANRSIAHNRARHEKTLRAIAPPGDRPVVVALADAVEQAAFVAQHLLELRDRRGIPLHEMAVLYRSHAHAIEVQHELARRAVPYAVRSGRHPVDGELGAAADGAALAGAAADAPPEEHVTLSTVHQAKGLEWTAVFVLWLAEGRFPHVAALRTAADEEEERRLFHVAVTRARRHLYLCCPAQGGGARGPLRPSRFIVELDGPAPPFERWEIAPGPAT